MSVEDNEILQEYVDEAREHLAEIEKGLLTIEKGGVEVDLDVVNNVFRAAHSIKGGAGFAGLTNIKELAHRMENILGMIRSRELIPNAEVVNILFLAFDKLRELVEKIEHSDEIDISQNTDALSRLIPLSSLKDQKDNISKNGLSQVSIEKSDEKESMTSKAPGPDGAAEETSVEPEPRKTQKESPPGSEDISSSVMQAEVSLRVHVNLLDSLMTLAGELVLGRNQLLQTISSGDQHELELVGQKIGMVTSELQEAIMLTRMQPIGNIFNKFPRVVRDLARSLGKEVGLTIEGGDVELDKTIIEGLSDPLTHLVRNSVDHGIEVPDIRRKQGKDPVGRIKLKAYHEAGQVNIEITDDGKGLDGNILAATGVQKGHITEEKARTMSDKEKVGLIFLPGFSTAKEVTDVSGRGVGLDVVKSNLDKLGGVVDIASEAGIGTTIRIKLPLTLAIIPSQIVSANGERYAIPQVNLDELLRIPASQVKDRIERVGDAEVVRLRGRLLPLICLADVLGIDRTYIDPADGEQKPDRRESLVDRRSMVSPLFEQGAEGEKAESSPEEYASHSTGQAKLNAQSSQPQSATPNEQPAPRNMEDRRYHARSAVNIVVVSAGTFQYGLVVDTLRDSEEIVVKPLGRHLKHCKGYAGATVMGDGRVVLILDVPGIARMAELTSMEGTDRAAQVAQEASEVATSKGEVQALLVFRNAVDEQFAVPLALVARIEKIKKTDIELVGGRKVIQYRGGSLPLFTINEVAEVKPLANKEELIAIVFVLGGREMGLLATGPVDAMEIAVEIDGSTLKQPGIMGSAIIGDYTTLMVDIFGLIESLQPEWFSERKEKNEKL